MWNKDDLDGLLKAAQANDSKAMECLLEAYKPLVRHAARSYFLVGADGEDLLQEGMIGLYRAILSFDFDKNHDFSAYAQVCIKRNIYTAIKAANREKHKPLNSYISLYLDKDDKQEIGTSIISLTDNPEDITIHKEEGEILNSRINKKLSSFEKEVLSEFLKGYSYLDIAKALKKDVKAIDNALQRIKRKLKDS